MLTSRARLQIKQRRIEAPAETKGFLGSLGLPFASGPTFVEFDDYFDTRRASLDTFELQLKALLTSLHAASAARVALYGGLADLEIALANLAHCEVSDALRGALEGAAVLQGKLRNLGEGQTRAEEGLGGLTSVAEGYARLCASAKVSLLWPLSRSAVAPMSAEADPRSFSRSSCSERGSRRSTHGKPPRTS